MNRLEAALTAAKSRFRQRAGADALALQVGLKDGDTPALHRIAHGIAGAAGLYGFDRAGELAERVEFMAKGHSAISPGLRIATEELAEALSRLGLETPE